MKKIFSLIFPSLCILLLIFSLRNLFTTFQEYHKANQEYEELQQYAVSISPLPDLPDADAPNTSDISDTTDIPNTIDISDTPNIYDTFYTPNGAATPDATDIAYKSKIPTETLYHQERTTNPPSINKHIDFPSLAEINPEIIGWIEIPDTAISYPFVHTNNNTYYLTHTFSNQENNTGSIFMEATNSSDFNDIYTILYGHNMKNGSMFATLKKYADTAFYKSHPCIYIDLKDGSHCYKIFSCHEVDVTDICFSTGYIVDEKYTDFVMQLKNSSLYDTGITPNGITPVITLSTCTGNSDKRFVVHAEKLY